jgi:uncharacterized protein (DUF2336 family)
MPKTHAPLDISIFEMVLESGDLSARLRLADELAQLAASPSAPAAERQSIQPVLARLAHDPVLELRTFLAEKLTEPEELADEVVFSIVADEPDIALNFLARARSLTEERMLAVLRVGDPGRQMIVASRGDISARVCAALIERGEVEAVEALLLNPACVLPPASAKLAFRRFAEVEPIVELLLARPDLPAVIRALQASRARDRLAEELFGNGWIAVNRAEELLQESEELALAAIAAGAADHERTELAGFLIQRQLLTSSLLLRLAARGEVAFIRTALAILGRGRIKHSPAKLVSRAELPEVCGLVLRLALEAADDGHGPGEAFGLKIIERLALAGEAISDALRARALAVLMEAGSETTKRVAEAIRGRLGLDRAA